MLELHGWGDVQTELNDLTRRGAWGEMAGRITDEMLEDVAVVAPDPERLPELLLARCRGVVDRLALTASSRDPERTADQVRRLRAA